MIKPFISIIRPWNCVFALLTTFFGAFYMQSISFTWQACFGIIAVFFISATGYVVNDYCDIEIDKINRPDRVLPRKLITPEVAKKYGFYLLRAGILCAVLSINFYCITLAAINSALLMWYAKKLKKALLVGNLIVAWNACSTFIFGSLLTENFHNIITITVIAFFLTFIRELIKSIEDIDGDKVGNVKSIATLYGASFTQKIVLIVSSILLLILISLYLLKVIPFLLLCSLNVLSTIPIIIYMGYVLYKKAIVNAKSISGALKYMMILVLILFLCDRGLIFVYGGI